MILRAFFAALLAVLTLTSSAWAECGWVLWSGGTLPWGGYKTERECEQRRRIAVLQDEEYSSRLRCLPDSEARSVDCKWVLWRSEIVSTPLLPFSSMQACERAQDAATRKRRQGDYIQFNCVESVGKSGDRFWLLRPSSRIRQLQRGIFATLDECHKRRTTMRREEAELMMCLPDTVDPRGPKGGGC